MEEEGIKTRKRKLFSGIFVLGLGKMINIRIKSKYELKLGSQEKPGKNKLGRRTKMYYENA